ncbi:hypothetical protein [Myxococcus faecalis]|uniref:hypothetical protein n=1 Tax=Myxococcus faecalis TaxID=3115646 RepID=UPI003CF8C82B
MMRHTLTKALEMVRARVASGDPDLHTALHFVARSRRLFPEPTAALSEKAVVIMDKLLDGIRYDATPQEMDSPFPAGPTEQQLLSYRGWTEACLTARRNMAPPGKGGLGLGTWSDVGGLTRLQALGLVTLALERLSRMPEFGAGPLFPGVQR